MVAFAFMVPDVKFNEAYISFIFTHPEWRGVGIAHFMLYHLIRVSHTSFGVESGTLDFKANDCRLAVL